MTEQPIDRPADNRLAVPTGEPSKGRIAVLTADKVEEVEFFYPYYRFTEAGYQVDVITPEGGELTGYRGFGIKETIPLAEADPADYLMLYVPGGLAPTALREVPEAIDFVRALNGCRGYPRRPTPRRETHDRYRRSLRHRCADGSRSREGRC